MPTLAALITYYRGTDADDMAAALESLAVQTRPAESIVIVRDGPVEAATRDVVKRFLDAHPEADHVKLTQNRGAGPALVEGMRHVDAEWVARLDSDDVATPGRFERQLAYLEEHPGVDVLGTALREFDDEVFRETGSLERAARGVRTLPENHPQIVRYARLNSPVNHPSVMMRTAAARRAGGYRDVHLMEDYDLWARMLATGARFHNLPEPLTWFRTSPAQTGRRTGWDMFAAERTMQRNLVSYGLVSKPRAILNFLVRSAYRLLPTALLERAYALLFHRRGTTDAAPGAGEAAD